MITEALVRQYFQEVVDKISNKHSLKCEIRISQDEITEETSYMNPEMFMYADEWFSILIQSTNYEIIFTLCICNKLHTGDNNCTYASINSAFVCPRLENKGIASDIVGGLNNMREDGLIAKVVLSDRSDTVETGISVWDKIFNKYPKLIKEKYNGKGNYNKK